MVNGLNGLRLVCFKDSFSVIISVLNEWLVENYLEINEHMQSNTLIENFISISFFSYVYVFFGISKFVLLHEYL